MEERVLLLNASWEPLRVISFRRAVVLVVQEKAEVVEETDLRIRSERQDFALPSVIRLTNYVKIPYRAKTPLNRRTVLIRDEHRCQFTHCNRKATTIDHVLPRSRGGKHVWENVVGACRKCNAEKSNKLMSETGWKLRNEPVQPNWNLWLVAGIREKEEWHPYLASFNY